MNCYPTCRSFIKSRLHVHISINQFLFYVCVISDHWYNDPRPTYALMEVIRGAIDDSTDLSYRKDFVDIIKSMGLEEPKMALAGLLDVLDTRRVANAEKQQKLILLCEEMTDLSGKKQDIVGPYCQKLGITPQWLQARDVLADDIIITNGIISELFQYRWRHSIGWKTVMDDWWCKLFPSDDNVPLTSTVLSNWGAVDRKKQLLIRDRPLKEKDEFLQEKYIHPTTKTPRPTEDNIHVDQVQQVDADDASSCVDEGYTSEVSVSPYMLRRHGDTIAILHELLEQEKQENCHLNHKLAESEMQRCVAETRASEAESAAREAETARAMKDAEMTKMTKEHKKQCSVYERELQAAADLSRELNKDMKSLKSANIVRRLATRDAQLKNKTEKVSKLEKDIEKLHQVIKELRRTKRNRTEQIHYNVNKCARIKEKFENENQSLKKKLQELEVDSDCLRNQLDEIMANTEVTTFEDGAYTSDIRVVCYELISRGVGSKHGSDIIRLVLQRVAGLDCGKLPKPTCIRYMAFEQALLSKHVAKEAIESTKIQ
ncbi:uncharacterized protein LOC121425060 [Lytechinus variegatus]|uniref:uncharacterized protein LOC121425060 n=1 Tax=Lytechinus variegatus TaxID=7654 RepID=UPI001BB1D8D0|nr:uncharacterized protein LOC121425060 [Lytechinus variegatus]